MSKLLRANFLRLRKDKYFWIGMIAMILYGVIDSVGQYRNLNVYDMSVTFDTVFFASHIIIGMLIAAFVSLYVGTEYSDGTIRNKLMVGCNRRDIYLSNFITCAAAGAFMNFAYMFTACITGIPLFGFFEMEWQKAVVYVLDGLLMVIALTAIFSMLSMLNQNKALVAIISMVGIFALLFLSLYITMKLGEPEFFDGVTMSKTVGDTVTQTIEKIPNPMYLSPSQRSVYQFLFDFLPTGQGIQISAGAVTHPCASGLYSVGITIVVSLVGIWGFNRKDLK